MLTHAWEGTGGGERHSACLKKVTFFKKVSDRWITRDPVGGCWITMHQWTDLKELHPIELQSKLISDLGPMISGSDDAFLGSDPSP